MSPDRTHRPANTPPGAPGQAPEQPADATSGQASRPSGREDPAQKASGRNLEQPASSGQLADIACTALENLKGVDIVQLDIAGKSSFADHMLVATGTSRRHVMSLADEVRLQAKKAGLPPLGVEGEDSGDWVLVDLGDVIVHVMTSDTRDFYALEKLWSVGPRAGTSDASASGSADADSVATVGSAGEANTGEANTAGTFATQGSAAGTAETDAGAPGDTGAPPLQNRLRSAAD